MSSTSTALSVSIDPNAFVQGKSPSIGIGIHEPAHEQINLAVDLRHLGGH